MRWLRDLADVFCPPVCRVCRRRGEYPLCRPCLDAFSLIAPPICLTCGRPLPGPRHSPCWTCRFRRHHFWQARAGGIYEGTLRDAVLALKFGRCPAMAAPLGRMMAQVVRTDRALASVRLLIPVPLHPQRQHERGFNQAELLALEVGRILGRPVLSGVLRRIIPTRAQSTLSVGDRRANVQDAFRVVSSLPPEPVLLIDDVMSTGWTASECAGQLRMAGAGRVSVLTAADALPSWIEVSG